MLNNLVDILCAARTWLVANAGDVVATSAPIAVIAWAVGWGV